MSSRVFELRPVRRGHRGADCRHRRPVGGSTGCHGASSVPGPSARPPDAHGPRLVPLSGRRDPFALGPAARPVRGQARPVPRQLLPSRCGGRVAAGQACARYGAVRCEPRRRCLAGLGARDACTGRDLVLARDGGLDREQPAGRGRGAGPIRRRCPTGPSWSRRCIRRQRPCVPMPTLCGSCRPTVRRS